MKTVLVYGDSNVWGEMPVARRLPREQHWANILQEKLGREYHVVQEGLSGRFAGRHSWNGESYCSGQSCFEVVFRSASPVDIVVLALGTNDTSDRAKNLAEQVVEDILWYESKTKDIIKAFVNRDEPTPAFIYVLIPNFRETRDNGVNYNELEKRLAVNEILKQKVENFVEMNDIDLSSDGLHFSPKGHQQMAVAVFDKIIKSEK
jgi:lysophospholipase L1-like esterase